LLAEVLAEAKLVAVVVPAVLSLDQDFLLLQAEQFQSQLVMAAQMAGKQAKVDKIQYLVHLLLKAVGMEEVIHQEQLHKEVQAGEKVESPLVNSETEHNLMRQAILELMDLVMMAEHHMGLNGAAVAAAVPVQSEIMELLHKVVTAV
jgi:hypothetical protein